MNGDHTPTRGLIQMAAFTKAVRSQRKLRAAFDGPAGSGKTFTALRLAFSLVDAGLGTRIAVIDTENNSASLYAGEAPDGKPWDFDTMPLKQYGPDQFTFGLQTAVKEGYDVVVVDSLSHAWVGEGGVLDMVDQKGGNKFAAWKDITPLQRKMVDAIIRSQAHVIATMRSKTEYVLEDDENGKKVPRKVGMSPVQRDGLEFEFDVYGSLDTSHQIKITKTRCPVLDNATAIKPGPQFWAPLFDWLKSAAPSTATVPDEPPQFVTPSPIATAKPESEIVAEFTASLDAAKVAKDAHDIARSVKALNAERKISESSYKQLGEKYKSVLLKLPKSASPTPVKDATKSESGVAPAAA
jgi:hypothetical protein